jgi:hypothetical protein
VPISIPESLVVALPPIISPSSRTFVELTLVNWRRPWGSRRLDFVIRAGSFKFSFDKISKFCGCRQQQPDGISVHHVRLVISVNNLRQNDIGEFGSSESTSDHDQSRYKQLIVVYTSWQIPSSIRNKHQEKKATTADKYKFTERQEFSGQRLKQSRKATSRMAYEKEEINVKTESYSLRTSEKERSKKQVDILVENHVMTFTRQKKKILKADYFHVKIELFTSRPKYVHMYLLEKDSITRLLGQFGEKYFDYFARTTSRKIL